MSNPYTPPHVFVTDSKSSFGSSIIAICIGFAISVVLVRGFDTPILAGTAVGLLFAIFSYAVLSRSIHSFRGIGNSVAIALLLVLCIFLVVFAENRRAFNIKTKNAVDQIKKIHQEKLYRESQSLQPQD